MTDESGLEFADWIAVKNNVEFPLTGTQAFIDDSQRKAALDALAGLEHHCSGRSLAPEDDVYTDSVFRKLRAALSSPSVPVIEGLDKTLIAGEQCLATRNNDHMCRISVLVLSDLIDAARAYAALMKAGV